MKKEYHYKSETEIVEQLQRWSRDAPGRILWDLEQASLQRMLSGLFGYYLVQVGFPGYRSVPGITNGIRSWLIASRIDPGTDTGTWICSDPSQLPMATDSVDALVLPHTLDFSPTPQQVLREVERVLIPEGRLVLLGFNPWSLWGVTRLLQFRKGRAPWCGHFLSRRRLSDWLSLLGFRIEQTELLMFRPPIRHTGIMNRLKFMESVGNRYYSGFSAVYAVKAIKQVSTLTPIKPKWKLRENVFGGQAIEPTTRSSNVG